MAREPTSVFFLENPVDKGAWQATVNGVAKSQALLSTHACDISYKLTVPLVIFFVHANMCMSHYTMKILVLH